MKSIIDFLKPIIKKTIQYFIALLLSALGLASLDSCTVAYKCETSVDKMYVSPGKLCDSIYYDDRLTSFDIRADTIGYDVERQVEASNIMTEALKYLKDVGIRILGVSNK